MYVSRGQYVILQTFLAYYNVLGINRIPSSKNFTASNREKQNGYFIGVVFAIIG